MLCYLAFNIPTHASPFLHVLGQDYSWGSNRPSARRAQLLKPLRILPSLIICSWYLAFSPFLHVSGEDCARGSNWPASRRAQLLKPLRILPFLTICSWYLGRSGPNLEPGTMRVYVTNSPQNGLNIGRKVGPCPGSRRRWVLRSVHAFSQAVYAAHTYRPRFQVRTRPC